MGIENPEAVALAQLDTNGKLYVDLYDDKSPGRNPSRKRS